MLDLTADAPPQPASPETLHQSPSESSSQLASRQPTEVTPPPKAERTQRAEWAKQPTQLVPSNPQARAHLLGDSLSIGYPESIVSEPIFSHSDSGKTVEHFLDQSDKRGTSVVEHSDSGKTVERFLEPAKESAVRPIADSSQPTQQLSSDQSSTAIRSKSDPIEPTPSSTAKAETDSSSAVLPTTITQVAQVSKDFTIFPVGLEIGQRTVSNGILVRGQENADQAIDLENWLLPYDAIVQSLRLKTNLLPNGQVELQPSESQIRIKLDQINVDSKLGAVFSVRDLQDKLGVKAEFDSTNYALRLTAPWLERAPQERLAPLPLNLETLPQIQPQTATLSVLEQRIDASGNARSSTTYGSLVGVGTVLGGSWFARLNQPGFWDARSWQLAELQFQRQTETADYVLGSQPVFWQHHAGIAGDRWSGDYWGFTTVQRQGFKPLNDLFGVGFDPRQRMQAARIGRTIEGSAEPGTLVRLVQGFGERILAEVLVDSSGVYRFDDVPVETQFFNNYRLLIYPRGQRTAAPEVRDVFFSTTAEQLPVGASALIVSGGFQRRMDNSLFGDFQEFRGGIAQRWGVAPGLTLGAGGVYDGSVRGLADLFFQPENVPLQASVSLLSPNNQGNWGFNADLYLNYAPTFTARFVHNSFSSRLNLAWQAFQGVTFLANTDSRDATSAGVQFAFGDRNSRGLARVLLDTKNRLRWNWFQSIGDFELRHLGNEIGTQSELAYSFLPGIEYGTGHSLIMNYDTRNDTPSSLGTIGWRYRSPKRSVSGASLWEVELGYGIGSRRSGLIAAVQTSIVPGIQIRARYQGAAMFEGDSSFRVELISGLNFQRGIAPGDLLGTRLRSQGGMAVQAFFDRNHNGKRDGDEEVHLDRNLLIVNHLPVPESQVEQQPEHLRLRLTPETYRLEIDPAGIPNGWIAKMTALAVQVVPGSDTPVMIPLTRSYALEGLVTDDKGEPLTGVKIEAVGQRSQQRFFAITNAQGEYSLQELPTDSYSLYLDGAKARSESIRLDDATKMRYEMRLQKER